MLAAFALPPFLLMAAGSSQLHVYAEGISSRPLAHRIQRYGPEGAEVACYRCFPPGLAFYLGHPITVISEDGQEIPSNYIAFGLTMPPWPQQMVRLDDADTWSASRTGPVLILTSGTSPQSWVAGVAAARGVTMAQPGPKWWGALIPPAASM